MKNIIDIKEHIEDRKWNENITEMLLYISNGNPEELLIILESYLVGKRKINGEF